MGAERRRHVRVPYSQRGWFEAGAITLYAAVGNISEGGVFVRTHAPLARGTLAMVRLPVGNGGEIEAEAEVMWESSGSQGPAGMGLRFKTMDDQGRERLTAFLKDRGEG
ncbi:MAG: PilZ domain-containing protein [Deltaproteobacteria bacterium]|nr:PilZ domain-containing protein [Deltaproteobacteria bacterium]